MAKSIKIGRSRRSFARLVFVAASMRLTSVQSGPDGSVSPVYTRGLNGIRQMQWTPTADSAITKERSERSGHVPDRYPAPSSSTAFSQVAVDVDGLRLRQ